MTENNKKAQVVRSLEDYARASKELGADVPVYARVRFGADGSFVFGQVYVDVPVNEAANEEFFGDGKGSFVLESGEKLEIRGTQASIIAKAKHSYERCRGEAKGLSWLDRAFEHYASAKARAGDEFNASAWWEEYANAYPVSVEQLQAVQAMFDAYTGPSGKRQVKTQTVSQSALEAELARNGGDVVAALAKLGVRVGA
jgi:hypothetical protein